MRYSIPFFVTLMVVGSLTTGARAQDEQIQASPPDRAGSSGNALPSGPNGAARVRAKADLTTGILGGGLLSSEIGREGVQRFDCRHVIDLLIRRAHLTRLGEKAVVPHMLHFDEAAGAHVIATPKLGDLVLESVGMVADATADTAPVYALTIRNQGKSDAPFFHVSAVAVLGEIHEFSPTTTIKIPRLRAGQTVTVQVSLPFAAMGMGNANRRLPFDILVVAIDAFDAIPECDELNNILVARRIGIKAVATKAETTIEKVVPGEKPSSTGNDAPLEAPGDKKRSPLEGIDLDNLDLPEADGAAVRIK